ncbi:uncharacterized protein LOC105692961 [Athalia rosae]|uniref:uncharacterized protein LOC105692961 n=1 Tax=Athalia rosae TaxID=37344 RepID=UPI000DE7FCF5|nr:uncharacterized protein LOC105692961 [Athalia rosae]
MMGKCSMVILTMLIAASHSAPRRQRRTPVPSWHKPCGQSLVQVMRVIENFEEEIREGIDNIALQHQITLNNYLYSDYDFLYERARLGVQKHQYIPSWVPGKKDVNSVKKLKNSSIETIANHLPKLHTDLQKFAVAFEELVQDENDENIHRTLKSTQSYLLMTLCEVESVLSTFPPLRIPRRINRSIMSHAERNPVDDTRRMVRDWGVLLKYKDYLHAWRHVFDY